MKSLVSSRVSIPRACQDIVGQFTSSDDANIPVFVMVVVSSDGSEHNVLFIAKVPHLCNIYTHVQPIKLLA